MLPNPITLDGAEAAMCLYAAMLDALEKSDTPAMPNLAALYDGEHPAQNNYPNEYNGGSGGLRWYCIDAGDSLAEMWSTIPDSYKEQQPCFDYGFVVEVLAVLERKNYPLLSVGDVADTIKLELAARV